MTPSNQNWLWNTPDRALETAYQAIRTIRTIQDDYIIYALETQPLENVKGYLKNEFAKYERIARFRLLEFQISSKFLNQNKQYPNQMYRIHAIQTCLNQLETWKQVYLAPSVQPTPEPKLPPTPRRLSFEKTGLVPRSIPRTFDRFRRELSPQTETVLLQEFRLSRYQTLASFQYLSSLIWIPWVVSWGVRLILLEPITGYCWNQFHGDIFLHSYQQDRAFSEMQAFQETLYYELLTGEAPDPRPEVLHARLEAKAIDLAEGYNQESINSITNLLSDFIAVITVIWLLIIQTPQLTIVKSFLDEFLYSLSDATKAFLIILGTDIFVGFHSPHGWEILLELTLRHLGLPESKTFICLFVATFPVLLDTVFKYWIFRYLNQISPSTVATYHNMNE